MTTTDPRLPDARLWPPPADIRLADWTTWLNLTDTPSTHRRYDPTSSFQVHAGVVIEPSVWPTDPLSRIYVAYDEHGPAYVGQTNQPLPHRIRNHFGRQTTTQQRLKAGTWQLVAAAAFTDPTTTELDRLERRAAEWLLPLRHRTGRRHPRPLS